MYWANEDADCCGHCCFGADRPFDMKITDIHNNEVMHFMRPIQMGFSDSIEVSAPIGQIAGRIVKEFNLFPTFKVKNHNNDTVLRIEGPAVTTSFFGDVEFKVTLQTVLKLNVFPTTFGSISDLFIEWRSSW